jgi:dipeptidyl aminopeptidase/acylaminoacyl peptidase
MAAWAPTRTDRFRAAVAMSVVADNASFFATSEVWGYLRIILGGDPHERPDVYADRSPVTHAGRSPTPTLVLQGERDRCTPVGQGEELFGALVAAGVETELVIYPREGHVNVERAHALDAIRRTQAWFDRCLTPEGESR